MHFTVLDNTNPIIQEENDSKGNIDVTAVGVVCLKWHSVQDSMYNVSIDT